MDKAPVVLPGEDQDPLRWVRNAREVETETAIAPPRRRPQPPRDSEGGSRDSAAPDAEQTLHDRPQAITREDDAEAASAPALPRGKRDKMIANRKKIVGPKAVKRHLRPLSGAEEVLEACEHIWPKWANNGCRRVNLRGSRYGVVRGPKPDEAAAALRVVAVQMINRLSGGERLLQARDRRILGLVEALVATPPRPAPGEDPQDLSGASDPRSADAETSGAAAQTAAAQPSAGAAGAAAPGGSDDDGAAAAQGAGDGAAPPRAPAQKPSAGWPNPIYTTDALWSLAVIGGPVLFEEEMEALIAGASLDADWRPSILSDALWALALAHHWTPRLPELESLMLRLGGVPAFTAREAASSLWAFATLGHVPAAVLEEVDAAGGWQFEHPWPRPGQRLRGIDALSGKQLVSVAWALAAMEQVQTQPFTWLWEEIQRRGLDGIGRSPKALMQLHQVAIAVQVEGLPQQQHRQRREAGGAAADLLAAAQEMWEARVKPMHDRKESYYEGQVTSALVGLGRFHVKEDVTSGYSIDAALPETRVAVECDGPSHFARSNTDMLLGHARMKHRHLTALGWKVLSVRWTDWDELLGSRMQQGFLDARLKQLEHGNS